MHRKPERIPPLARCRYKRKKCHACIPAPAADVEKVTVGEGTDVFIEIVTDGDIINTLHLATSPVGERLRRRMRSGNVGKAERHGGAQGGDMTRTPAGIAGDRGSTPSDQD